MLNYGLEKVKPIIKKEQEIIRVQNVFLNKNKDIALIQTTVIDELHQELMMEIDTSEGKTTLSLFLKKDSVKANGVKTSIGLAALLILEMSPNPRIIRTNIGSFILRKP